MCAISGMVGLDHNSNLTSQMLETMHRRGPDDRGSFIDGECCLLHSRLTVIDPEGGLQPMKLEFANEHYTIVYNGELYNTNEIRQSLEQLNHRFCGHSDTEVVLHAFAQWGSECLQLFNGIFAFAVWESKKQRLFLARDRMGVKPLFYTLHRNGILFASEIKTILCYPTMEACIDEQGVGQLLLLGPGRISGSGIFRGITELKPGQYAVFLKGQLQIQTYWKLLDREHRENFEETAEHIRYLVTDAIRRQMVSDVPIGTFLSGGLDSSIISAVCAEAMKQQGKKLDTFSVDYENSTQYFTPGKFQPDSDNAYIEIMCQALQSQQHWTVLTPQELWESLEDSTMARDLPGMGDVDFSMLAFCKQIRNHVKVALSGECADEIFGGYPWYRDPDIRARHGFPWAQNIDYRASFLQDEYTQRLDPKEFVMELYRDTLQQTDCLPDRSEEERRMKQMICLNHHWFMQTLLDRKDRMSMYSGLEVRVPFCDYRIAEYMYSVPWEYKDHQGREKGLLRYAMRGMLPDAVLYRKKSPYPKTFDPRYDQIVTQHLRQILGDPSQPIFQIVKPHALRNLADNEHPNPWYGQLMKRPQTIAYMLQLNDWLQRYRIRLL